MNNNKGFIIDHLFIDRVTEDYIGLFGNAVGATLKNIHIASGQVKGRDQVGAIAGSSTGTITGCTNVASVEGVARIGGIVGHSELAGSVITDCNNLSIAATVTGTGNYVGGIVGINGDHVTLAAGGTISDCTNAASVAGVSFVAGICGKNYGATTKITSCHNKSGGNVSGSAERVGGIVGSNGEEENPATVPVPVDGGKIYDCTNEALIVGVHNMGGITGVNYNGTIDKCTNDASVTGKEATPGNDIGGIAGACRGASPQITNSRNLQNGTVTGTAANTGGISGVNTGEITSCSNSANITSLGSSTGGIAGRIGSDAAITDSTNEGAIEGKGATSGFVGGICGYNSGTITGTTSATTNKGPVKSQGEIVGGICGYSVGAITTCSNTAPVESVQANFAGGICGRNHYFGTIDKSTNAGTIRGYDRYIGGIAGANNHVDAKLTSCHNLAGGKIYGITSTGGIVGFNAGLVEGCSNAENVEARQYMGGIVGNNDGSSSEIKGCWNSATVKGSNRLVGGISGNNLGKVTACYNIGAVTGTVVEIGAIMGGGTGSVSTSYFGEGANTFTSTAGSIKFGTGNSVAPNTGWPARGMVGWDAASYWATIGQWSPRAYPTLKP